MIELETIDCPIWEGSELINVSNKGRDYIITKVVVCKSCGFLFQNPRWTKAEILKFYETKYDRLYRTGFTTSTLSNVEYEAYKFGFAPVYKRIKKHIPNIKNPVIMDIGSGDGTNLKYLGRKLNTSRLKAIEPSLEGRNALKEKGIELVHFDVDMDWQSTLTENLDLVVLRHVFEHLHSPNDFLKSIRRSMSEKGILYVAVPDSYNIGKELLDREYFRIVHNFYFTKTSLTNMLQKNGFNIIEISEGDEYHQSELFVIAKPGSEKVLNWDKTEYLKQIDYLAPILKRERTLVGRLKGFIAYVKRQIYAYKVDLKRCIANLLK